MRVTEVERVKMLSRRATVRYVGMHFSVNDTSLIMVEKSLSTRYEYKWITLRLSLAAYIVILLG